LLAIVAEGRGDAAEQRRELDAAVAGLPDIQEKVIFGGVLSDACARAGFVDQAQKILLMIAPLADPRSSEQVGYVELLNGDVALTAGQRDAAIELFKQSDKENSTGISVEALAHAYQQSGEIDEATDAYASMFGSVDLSLGWEPQQRWVEARYTLATDYAARGDKQKARETLDKLLNQWKDADPNLPLLKKAKTEYAKLQ
jgi:tetratricopeptide (TPR) repeat protein